MRFFRYCDDVPADGRGAAVALGNFDGVHRGHQAVIKEAGRHAQRLGVPHGIVTFEPHPREILRPQEPPFRLTPLRSKALQMAGLGVDILYSLAFDRAFAAQSATDFINNVLLKCLGVRHITVGYDFVFGKEKSGNIGLLRQLAEASGVEVMVVSAVCQDARPETRSNAEMTPDEDEIISSTRIRNHLVAGEPREAANLLGRYWEIDGRVEHGQERGRTIAFPTANVALHSYLRPRSGVYAVRVGIGRLPGGAPVQRFDGVANIGSRPTVAGSDIRLEAHIFDFDGDLYGQNIRVEIIDWIRAEQRFDGLEALKMQIARDAASARQLLAALA